jgi:hypothetical protein
VTHLSVQVGLNCSHRFAIPYADPTRAALVRKALMQLHCLAELHGKGRFTTQDEQNTSWL